MATNRPKKPTGIGYQILPTTLSSETAHNPDKKRPESINLPFGIYSIQKISGHRLSYSVLQYMILALTFLIYMSYHASRRPLNVVKPILSPYKKTSKSFETCGNKGSTENSTASTNEGWAPFEGPSGENLLVDLDFTFLITYAIGVIIAGRIADRSNLRNYLLVGMVGSGLAVAAFGMGYYWNIHYFPFYLTIQILTGFLQASGWPAVVAIVAQWFGKSNLGLVMGLWNAHSSVGNSVGSALSALVVENGNWGSAFLLLGGLIATFGILFWFFLIPQPADAGYPSPDDKPIDTPNLTPRQEREGEKGSISWKTALSIPGLIPFSLALFFSKFVAYTFLFWLPYYIASICINEKQLSASEAGDFSILFDLGGIAGGAVAGLLYDKTQAGGLISVIYGLCSIPLLLMYNRVGRISVQMNMLLLTICGFCVNGPYALIATAVSATLGTHESVSRNERALSTVAAIIDGMGSLGAALGPTITGGILSGEFKGHDAFDNVFSMLAIASLLSVLTLLRAAWSELRSRNQKKGTNGIELSRKVDLH